MHALSAGAQTESTKDLSQAQVTALFCYLQHLANPISLRHLSAWDDCKQDYQKYNTLRQAGFWRTRAGYRRDGRLDRQRFQGHPTDGLYDAEKMTAEEAEQYLMTMRARAQGKERKARKQPVRVERVAAAVEDDNCPF